MKNLNQYKLLEVVWHGEANALMCCLIEHISLAQIQASIVPAGKCCHYKVK